MSGSSDSIPDTPAGAPPTLAPTPPTPPTPPKRRRSSGSAKPTPATPATPGGSSAGAGSEGKSEPGDKGEPGDKSDKSGSGSSGKRKRNALNPVSSAADEIAAWPVPGGLALLFVLIVVLLFVIVPVNGRRTRVQLIWDTVRGRVRLPGVQTQQDAAAASSSGQPSTASDLATAAQAALSSVLTGGAVGSGVPSLATGDVSGLGANESADGSSMLDALGLPDLSDFSAPDLESLYAN